MTIALKLGVESKINRKALDWEWRGAYATLISESVIEATEKVGNVRATMEFSP